MNTTPSKIIGGNGSAFQQPSKGTSNKKPENLSSISMDGHTVENIGGSSLPKAVTTTSLRSETIAAETTPRELSSHKIQHSVSSVSLQETNSNSRNTSSSSSEATRSFSASHSNEPIENRSAAIFVPQSRASRRESVIHEGFRAFLRQEKGAILEYHFELQKIQATCKDFLKEWEEECYHENTPLKNALLQRASRVFALQATMIEQTEPFVDLEEGSLNKAVNLPLPSAMARPWSRPRILEYLQHLTEFAHDLNRQLKASREAIQAIKQTDAVEIRSCYEKAAKATLKALENRLLSFTVFVNKGEQSIAQQYKQSAKYADYAAQCWADAAKIPQTKAQYLQQATTELHIQPPHPLLDSISKMMRVAGLSVKRAAVTYERASLAASATDERLRLQQENYSAVAINHDTAFGLFRDAAASLIGGKEEAAHLLKKEALGRSRAAKYYGMACALELSEDLVEYHEKAVALREIADSYKDASNIFFEAFNKLTLAEEAETDALAHELHQEKEACYNWAINAEADTFQNQQALEATFPPEILARLI